MAAALEHFRGDEFQDKLLGGRGRNPYGLTLSVSTGGALSPTTFGVGSIQRSMSSLSDRQRKSNESVIADWRNARSSHLASAVHRPMNIAVDSSDTCSSANSSFCVRTSTMQWGEVDSHEEDVVSDEGNVMASPTEVKTKLARGSSSPEGVDKFRIGELMPMIPSRLSWVACDKGDVVDLISKNPNCYFFTNDYYKRYHSFCSDFGPVNLGMVVRFSDYFRTKMRDSRLTNRHLVFYSETATESLANVAFLLATYLCICERFTVAQAISTLKNVPESVSRGFRDATQTSSSFWLSIEDCVSGVSKAHEAGWFNIEDFDLDEYDLWDQNLSGYLHKVCPRLIALRGPADKAGMCPPEEFIEHFQDQNVTDIIRLGNGESELYDPAVYTDQGMTLHEIHFDECSLPSHTEVTSFLDIVDAARGKVAVHCPSGLGATGTMIGLWIMRNMGWRGREVMGWLRVVRPGSVLGGQQHYLDAMSDVRWDMNRMGQGASASSLRIANCLVAGDSSEQIKHAINAAQIQRTVQAARASITGVIGSFKNSFKSSKNSLGSESFGLASPLNRSRPTSPRGSRIQPRCRSPLSPGSSPMLGRHRSNIDMSMQLDSETPSTPGSPSSTRFFMLHGSVRSINQSSFRSTSSGKFGVDRPESPTGAMNSPFRDALRSVFGARPSSPNGSEREAWRESSSFRGSRGDVAAQSSQTGVSPMPGAGWRREGSFSVSRGSRGWQSPAVKPQSSPDFNPSPLLGLTPCARPPPSPGKPRRLHVEPPSEVDLDLPRLGSTQFFSNGVKHRSLNCCCGPSEEGLESLREEFSRVPSNSSGKTSDGSGGGSPIAALQRKPTDGVSHHTGAPYPIAASHPKDSSLDTVVSSDSLDLGSRSFEGCLGQFENEVAGLPPADPPLSTQYAARII